MARIAPEIFRKRLLIEGYFARPTLDSGAFVVGLEYATGRRAVVAGKPAPDVFRAAFADLADDVTRRGVVRDGGALRRREVAMVGDDPRTDLAPARRLGMRTALVLTGRHGREQLDGLGVRGRSQAPDLVADSIVDVVAAVIPTRRQGPRARQETAQPARRPPASE